MATGGGLALPEPLQDEDSRSWFKRFEVSLAWPDRFFPFLFVPPPQIKTEKSGLATRDYFEVCAAANGWDGAKKLLRLPTLLKGRAWAIYDALDEGDTDTYDHLKGALLRLFSPDTEEDRLAAREQLSRRKLQEGRESIDEVARDLEKLLDKSSPGLPAAIRDTELRYHLINSLPERIAFQLKLLPKTNFVETIAKARELCLIYSRTNTSESVNQIQHDKEATRLDQMEATLQSLSEQLLALNTGRQDPPQCLNCGKWGHMARNCRARRAPPITVTCFNCGKRGHLARNCRSKQQGNGQGGTPTQRAGGAPRPW